MKQDVLSINLLFPVLNERLRLENGIERSMAYLKENEKSKAFKQFIDYVVGEKNDW
jgi:hypothetical protein